MRLIVDVEGVIRSCAGLPQSIPSLAGTDTGGTVAGDEHRGTLHRRQIIRYEAEYTVAVGRHCNTK